MHQTQTDLMAFAARDAPLPPGAALAFTRVGGDPGFDLPEAIRRCAPRRQATFASGRKAARDALRKAGHRGDPIPGIAEDGLPDWPAGWLGSISHSDEIAAALVAPIGGVRLLGLDVERIVTAEVALQIAPDVMPERPLGQPPNLRSRGPFPPRRRFTRRSIP